MWPLIALAVALASLSAILAGFTAMCGVWLHSANKEKDNLRDTLDAEQMRGQEWRSKYESEIVVHGAAIKAREQEHTRRMIAETNLREAQRRLSAYLAHRMKGATKDEVNAVLADVFASSGLSLVPQPEAGEPGPDDIINPFAPVV
jgi:hypothetical protein